jgi:class 3 adenylate cyclase/pimeloyl-ACP methyl ester carboxylesterase
MEPQVQYVRSADGTAIAYTDMGDGVPLVFSSNIWTHLTRTWQGAWRDAWLQLISDGFRLIRYDMRGMGMSTRDVEDFSLDVQMADLEALREHVELDRFALYGNVHATPACISYAAAHPERLTHLILDVPFRRGEEWYQALPTLRGLESFREMGDEQWELYTLTHAATLSAASGGSDTQWLAELMRVSTAPATLRRYFAALRTQDVTLLLSQVRTPTLIFQRSSGLGGQFAHVVAAAIPDARLFDASVITMGLSARDVEVTTQFVLGRDSVRRARPAVGESPDTAIILFADIVDSTALTERMGDAAFRDRARALDTSLRKIITEAGGSTIDAKTLGDGVLATFPAASQAIDAALRCGAAGDEQSLPLHLGLHAGDVIREANNVFGGAVNIASRISALSAPGEVLVSDIVRGLARTSAGVTFEDRGEHALKGIADPQRVYAVRRAVNESPQETA